MSTSSFETIVGDLPLMADSFRRALRAANKADRTVSTYLAAVEQLTTFLADQELPTDAADITRDHIRRYVEWVLSTNKPATASNRHRALQQFFKYLAEEGEIDVSPMAGMKPPFVPEEPVPVVAENDLRKLLKTCEGSSFTDKRDNAIIRLLYDTGIRRHELVGLTVADLNLDLPGGVAVAHVLGKGRKQRNAPFGRQTQRALDRYLRARRRHPYAHLPQLWLGTKGPLTATGVAQMLRRKCGRANVAHVHPHQLRHTWAHTYMRDGGNEGDLMMLAGWSDRSMLDRYGRSAAAERAIAAHSRMSAGDRL